MTEIPGLDWSFARPDPHTLYALGYRFAVRYLSPLLPSGLPNPKDVSAAELASLRASGLSVALVFESTADRALVGSGAGATDGQTARARAARVGYPEGAVIFWACDTDVTSTAQMVQVDAYGQGFASGLAGAYPTGPYGQFSVVEYCAVNFPHAWQAGAWSGDQLSKRANLYQRRSPSGRWPVVTGTDENVSCLPLPMMAPAGGVALFPGARPAPAPAPTPPAPSFDAVGYVTRLSGAQGDRGAIWQYVQEWGNEYFGAYCKIAPVAPAYGPQTAAFVCAFDHRAATDPALSAWSARLAGSDGRNVGQATAAAFVHYGLPEYLLRRGFRG